MQGLAWRLVIVEVSMFLHPNCAAMLRDTESGCGSLNDGVAYLAARSIDGLHRKRTDGVQVDCNATYFKVVTIVTADQDSVFDSPALRAVVSEAMTQVLEFTPRVMTESIFWLWEATAKPDGLHGTFAQKQGELQAFAPATATHGIAIVQRH